MAKELNNLFLIAENVIGFPKLLKFVRVNKFYIPNGNPWFFISDTYKINLFSLGKEMLMNNPH